MIAISAYLIIGAVIGFSALKHVLGELEEGNQSNDRTLEKTRILINKIGLEAFLLSMLIIFSVFWLPMILHEILANKIKK